MTLSTSAFVVLAALAAVGALTVGSVIYALIYWTWWDHKYMNRGRYCPRGAGRRSWGSKQSWSDRAHQEENSNE